jgi:hypothetical protein
MKTIVILLLILTSTDLLSQRTNSIHVIVALCDNENQGIVPVPELLGNGNKPSTNLYWGALYGIKTYFNNSPHWNNISEQKNLNDTIVERIIFKHIKSNTFLIADAYYGHAIDFATINVIQSGLGEKKQQIELKHDSKNFYLGLYGDANLICYIGHNGLMDFLYEHYLEKRDDKIRDIIILACKSKSYFSKYLMDTNVNPIILTTGLMAPEAYTLESVLEGWINKESKEEIKLRAVKAYNKYQKCGLRAAKELFDNKWE